MADELPGDKLCPNCKKKVLPSLRADAVYCSALCRVQACRQRNKQAPPTQSRESASPAPLIEPSSTVADTSPAKPKKSPTEQLREVVERHEAHLAQMQRTTTDAAMAGMEQRLDGLRTEFEAKWQKSTTDLLARLRREVPGLDEYLTRKLQPSPPPPTVPLLTYDESYKAVPPVNTDEEVQRKLLNQAIEQGYNPATDVLAFAKLEELRAFDRVARWQKENGKPPTVKVIPPDKDREFLAAVGARHERLHYFANRPPGRHKPVTWIHHGWELDPESEADLLRRVYSRIRERLRIPTK